MHSGQRLPIEPGACYVFDKGYYDFGFWAKLIAAGCRFVTRLKANTPIAALIAHLLVRLAQLQNRCSLAPQAILRLATLALFQRRPIGDLLKPPIPTVTIPDVQLRLATI